MYALCFTFNYINLGIQLVTEVILFVSSEFGLYRVNLGLLHPKHILMCIFIKMKIEKLKQKIDLII